MNDAAQGVVEDVPQDVAQDLGFGPGQRSPSSPRHHRRRPVFVHLALRWGRNWAAQWHLAWAVGKRFQRCRAKRLYVDLKRYVGYPLCIWCSSGHGLFFGRRVPDWVLKYE